MSVFERRGNAEDKPMDDTTLIEQNETKSSSSKALSTQKNSYDTLAKEAEAPPPQSSKYLVHTPGTPLRKNVALWKQHCPKGEG